jgi:hypothetical protein
MAWTEMAEMMVAKTGLRIEQTELSKTGHRIKQTELSKTGHRIKQTELSKTGHRTKQTEPSRTLWGMTPPTAIPRLRPKKVPTLRANRIGEAHPLMA